MNVRGLKAQRFLKNLVHKSRHGRFERRVGLLALHVKDNLLVDFSPAPFFTQLLDRLGSQSKVFLNHRVNRTGCGEHNFEPFAEQQLQIALFHLARRLAESQRQAIVVRADGQQVIMENEFHRHQFERFAFQFQTHRIDEFHMAGGRQRAPGVLLRGQVQVHNRAVLRQLEPMLTTAHLLELLLGKLTLLEQQIARFLLRRSRVHWIGTR